MAARMSVLGPFVAPVASMVQRPEREALPAGDRDIATVLQAQAGRLDLGLPLAEAGALGVEEALQRPS